MKTYRTYAADGREIRVTVPGRDEDEPAHIAECLRDPFTGPDPDCAACLYYAATYGAGR